MNDACYVLGISAFYHDSAAALVRDGELIAAAQEERFSRKKHDPSFPANALNYCLEEAEIEASDLAAVVFYDHPVLTLDRVVRSLAGAGEQGLEVWLHGAEQMLGVKLQVASWLREELKTDVKVLFAEHHLSHAASAFYPSPFDQAAILTLDGVGEWATTTLGRAEGEDLQLFKEIRYPHSLGLLYSAFTQFCGFRVNSGEYKLMGLAPYGKPIYADLIRTRMIDVQEDGSFRLDMRYFGYQQSLSMINEAFAELFGGAAREPETPITQREMDVAASIQLVTEEIVFKMARHLREVTGMRHLCMAGGVALNCVVNGKLVRDKIFDEIWIQPAAGDAGGAAGAALLASHLYFKVPRPPAVRDRDRQRGSYLGPAFSNAEIRAFLDDFEVPYTVVDDEERPRLVARELAAGKIVGYFVGRMEFGPRALGARSILGDARNSRTQSVMNLKIKYRESFRPFAPSVLAERCSEFFELEGGSPYMLLVAPVRDELRRPVEECAGEDLLGRINQVRSTIPAVTHVDYSARVQTVDGHCKPDYYRVIEETGMLTGVPVIVNTSFNVRGEPIVCTPQEAHKCFMRTEMDVLVLENCVLYKDEQPEYLDKEDWRDEYELD